MQVPWSGEGGKEGRVCLELERDDGRKTSRKETKKKDGRNVDGAVRYQ